MFSLTFFFFSQIVSPSSIITNQICWVFHSSFSLHYSFPNQHVCFVSIANYQWLLVIHIHFLHKMSPSSDPISCATIIFRFSFLAQRPTHFGFALCIKVQQHWQVQNDGGMLNSSNFIFSYRSHNLFIFPKMVSFHHSDNYIHKNKS
jgi:hypothetical protein